MEEWLTQTGRFQLILEQRISEYKEKQKDILSKLNAPAKRVAEQHMEAGSSNWLSCLPLNKYGLVMNS